MKQHIVDTGRSSGFHAVSLCRKPMSVKTVDYAAVNRLARSSGEEAVCSVCWRKAGY